jgi:hypothetical protein
MKVGGRGRVRQPVLSYQEESIVLLHVDPEPSVGLGDHTCEQGDERHSIFAPRNPVAWVALPAHGGLTTSKLFGNPHWNPLNQREWLRPHPAMSTASIEQ